MKRRAVAAFSGSKGTVSLVTTRNSKRNAVEFPSASMMVNYCKANRIKARMIAVQ